RSFCYYVFGLVARERAQRLGLLGAVVAELRDDLERGVVVGGLEDLHHVVAAQSHPDTAKPPTGFLDLPLAVLDPVAPGGQAHATLRRPANERDVLLHARI